MNPRKVVVASVLVAAIALVTAVAFAQEHGGGGHAAPAGEHGVVPGKAVNDHGEHGGAHAGGGHHGPAPINWTDIGDKSRPAYLALVINVGLLFALYYTLGKKPIVEALKQRRINVGKEIDEAQKMLAEAKERAKKYQGDLGNAEADAETARNALLAAGQGEVERLLREAAEKAERMKRDAERLVDQERKQVRSELHTETVELALDEAKKVLQRAVSPEDHARLADDLLAELSRHPSATRGAS